MLVVYRGIEIDPLAAEYQGAAAHRARACCCSGGLTAQPADSGRCCRSLRPSIRASQKPDSSGDFSFPALTGMVGFWATLSLNIPDFSRYAKSQRDQIIGQALGLPLTMALYSFIGVAVTSATAIIFGQTIWDPVDVLTQFQESRRAGHRHARAVHRHARHQYRRQRRLARPTISPISRPADFLPHGRLDHRYHRRR